MAILLISCSKEEYIPMFASAQQRTVELSCVDKDGNDLLADENFVNQIKIYGCLSKKELEYRISEIKKDGKSQKYLYFLQTFQILMICNMKEIMWRMAGHNLF